MKHYSGLAKPQNIVERLKFNLKLTNRAFLLELIESYPVPFDTPNRVPRVI